MECDLKCSECETRPDNCIVCSSKAKKNNNPPLCDECPSKTNWVVEQ
jgi:hypothetical protein